MEAFIYIFHVWVRLLFKNQLFYQYIHALSVDNKLYIRVI